MRMVRLEESLFGVVPMLSTQAQDNGSCRITCFPLPKRLAVHKRMNMDMKQRVPKRSSGPALDRMSILALSRPSTVQCARHHLRVLSHSPPRPAISLPRRFLHRMGCGCYPRTQAQT